jgi:DNA-binding CsgD family transcriptional regulator
MLTRLVETLSIEDTQHLNQGIQKLYTLHDLDTFGVTALSIVNRLVPSDIPDFHATDLRSRKVSSIFLPDFPGYTPKMNRVIHQHFREHPIVARMPQTINGVYKISDFISRSELHCLEGLYQQFLRPLDTEDQITFFLQNASPDSCCSLTQTNTTLVGFSLNRNRCNFTERDRLILNLLRSHLSQAYINAQKYQQLQQECSQLHQSLNHLCVIILDTQGRIKSLAEPLASQAIILMETYFGKPTSHGQLPDHLWSWVKHQIICLTKNIDLHPTCLPLRIQQAGRELTIRLVVDQPDRRYLLLLEEQKLSSLNSLALLGLSQRETEVLSLVIQGKNNQEIASQLSVYPSTIRKHLENIYGKWGVKSRAKAISHALDRLGFF